MVKHYVHHMNELNSKEDSIDHSLIMNYHVQVDLMLQSKWEYTYQNDRIRIKKIFCSTFFCFYKVTKRWYIRKQIKLLTCCDCRLVLTDDDVLIFFFVFDLVDRIMSIDIPTWKHFANLHAEHTWRLLILISHWPSNLHFSVA